MTTGSVGYPVVFEVDVPERMSRWLWLVKVLLLIPHLIPLWIMSVVVALSIVVTWVAIILTGKHPRGLFNFNVGFSRWNARVGGYGGLLTDKYPPFSRGEEPGYPVRLKVEYPQKSSRLSALFRWLLVVPHWIAVGVLGIVFYVLLIVQVLVLIITGKPHTGVFRMMVGIYRWDMRVVQYAYLSTDRYPPFGFN